MIYQMTLHRFLAFSLGQRDQLVRHPFAYALRDRVVNADSSIVPFVAISFGAALAFVVFSLFETDNDASHDFLPVLKLNTASHDRKSGGPVFLRRARVLLGNGQVVQWWKWPARKIFDELVFHLCVRPVRMLLSQRLRATKNVRDRGLLLSHIRPLSA